MRCFLVLLFTVEKAARFYAKTELSMVRFVYEKAPCKCLKKLKSKLKEKYGPQQIETCKHCQKEEMAGDDFLLCSGCLGTYCSEVCRKADWDNGKHGGICKSRSGKMAVRRFNKLLEIFPEGDPNSIFEQLPKEQLDQF